jgi:hypothetical protein
MTSKTMLWQGFPDCALIVRRADPLTAHQPGKILVVDYRVLHGHPDQRARDLGVLDVVNLQGPCGGRLRLEIEKE